MPTPTKARSQRTFLLITAGAILAVGLAVLLVATGVFNQGGNADAAPNTISGEHELKDMSGNKVVLDEELPDQGAVEEMDIQETKDRLVLDRVGLDVRLKDMNVVNGNATPPTLDAAFTLRGYGLASDDGKGTTYIATHSVRGGAAPGNKLIDVPNKSASVIVGDTVKAYGNTYEVEKVFTSEKDKTPTNDDIWEKKDGRLVILTCLQRPDGTRSVENVVIQAQKV